MRGQSVRDWPFLPSPADLTACRYCQVVTAYAELLELDEVKLDFSDGALEAIADEALSRDTGARALRSVIEEFMLDIMYEIPKDDNIGKVLITREYIEHQGGPVVTMRGVESALLTAGPDSGN